MSRLRIGLEPLAAVAAVAWSALFGDLAVMRHLAGGSSAEDLGFTDQVIWNVLRGEWFRMSVYQGATWNTEIDLSRMAHPESLLAFHVEPMLLLFVPLYALGGGASLLLMIQAAAVGLGAWPAYRIGRALAGTAWAGLAVALSYLLSPLGQWAVLSDFHTPTLAAPILLLSIERLVVGHAPRQAFAAAVVALAAREDVGPVMAVLGVCLILVRRQRWLAIACVSLGLAWTVVAELIVHTYSGGLSPFGARYATSLGQGLPGILDALGRRADLEYGLTLLVSGGWLGLLAPVALLPALPHLALNAVSSSLWMASGRAHYSALVLPFITVGAAAGLPRLATWVPARIPSLCLVLLSGVGYIAAGAGPLGGNYAPAQVTDHARQAQALAASLPPTAAVSASASLVPHLSHRPSVYVFPAVEDAAYVLLDLRANPAPTSAGDVFLRIRSLLARGGWLVQTASDGLLLLQRDPAQPPSRIEDLPADLLAYLQPQQLDPQPAAQPQHTYLDGRLSLLSATLEPAPSSVVAPNGVHGVLHTVWRAEQPLPAGTRLAFDFELTDGERLEAADLAPLWWRPPEHWTPGVPVAVDVPGVPMQVLADWQAVVSTPWNLRTEGRCLRPLTQAVSARSDP